MRIRSTATAGVLAGVVLLASAPPAAADYVRDQQWMVKRFDLEGAWKHSTGEGVTVAVVDTGVVADHPDLTGNVLEGKDFTGDGDPHKDVNGHGTGMASLVAGHGHGPQNDSGMVGAAPDAKILPVRVREGTDKLADETWAKGVKYAVDEGADVINLSFGDGSVGASSWALEAIAYAQKRDVLVVGGAGNDGGDVIFPAAIPGVMAVGGVERTGERWVGSGSGKDLDLMAPGVDVLSADPTNEKGYSIANGTSNSAAIVSGIAALIRAKYPDLTAGQVANRLVKSATMLGQKDRKLPDEEYGYGIALPKAALTADISAGPKEGPLGKATPLPTAPVHDPALRETGLSSAKKTAIAIAGGAALLLVIGIVPVLRVRR